MRDFFPFSLIREKFFCISCQQGIVSKSRSHGCCSVNKLWLYFVTEVVSNKFTNWGLWCWLGWRASKQCMFKVTFGFIFHKNLKGWLSGQVVQETKGTSASAVYTTRTAEMSDFHPQRVRHSFQFPDPESSKGTQRLLWLLSGRDIWFRCVYIRHKALVCEAGYSHIFWVNIKGMDW